MLIWNSTDEEGVVIINLMGDIDPAYYKDVMLALDVEGGPDVQLAALD